MKEAGLVPEEAVEEFPVNAGSLGHVLPVPPAWAPQGVMRMHQSSSGTT